MLPLSVVDQFRRQIDVSFSCIVPINNKTIVKLALELRGDGRVGPQTSLTMS